MDKLFQTPNLKLYQGDCLEVLKSIPDSSVDLIFTSPPYADQRKSTYGGVFNSVYQSVGEFNETL